MSDVFNWLKEKLEQFAPQDNSAKSENESSRQSQRKNVVTQKAADPVVNNKVEIFKNSLGMEFCRVSAGQFVMGSDVMPAERPRHKVRISKDFFLGKHTVTQQQFIEIMGYNPSYSQGEKLPQLSMLAATEKDHAFFEQKVKPTQPEFLPDLPVENLSWEEAVEFCMKLSIKEGRRYRLPTEAEWEFACRAGTNGEFFWGNGMNEDFCNYATIFAIRSGRRGENPWGLCDMLGNLWEWCGDWFGPYGPGEAVDPVGPDCGSEKVYRGGSYDIDIDTNCRCASRFTDPPANRRPDVGFRVLLET